MITKSSYRGVTWIDMESPSKADITKVRKEFDVHSMVAEEVLSPSIRPKVDVYSSHVYLVLHFPVYSYGKPGFDDDSTHPTREIDFILGKEFLITVHYEPINEFLDFTKLFEASELIDHGRNADIDASFIFYHILRGLYRGIENDLESINHNLHDIEAHIFQGDERRMVERISNVNRSLLDFRWALKNHEDILNSLESDAGDFFNESFSSHLRTLYNEYYKIWNVIESNKEIVNDLRITNDSLLSTKTAEVMKVLTILAFVTFPLSLVASLFGMNTVYTPLVGEKYGFWIIIALMAAATGCMFFYFKHKKWL